MYDSRIAAYKEIYRIRSGNSRESLVRLGRFTPEDGYSASVGKLLEEKEKANGLSLPDNDSSGLVGCYRAISEQGLQIPGDISVVGYNDISVANYLVPSLTTVRLHMELLGEEAVRILEEHIASGREIGLKIIVPARLIVRDSAGRVNKKCLVCSIQK